MGGNCGTPHRVVAFQARPQRERGTDEEPTS